jgi:hypothetical protein
MRPVSFCGRVTASACASTTPRSVSSAFARSKASRPVRERVFTISTAGPVSFASRRGGALRAASVSIRVRASVLRAKVRTAAPPRKGVVSCSRSACLHENCN